MNPDQGSYTPASEQYTRAGGRKGAQGGNFASPYPVPAIFPSQRASRGGAEMTRQIMGQGMGGRAGGQVPTPSRGRQGDSAGTLRPSTLNLKLSPLIPQP